MEVWTTCDIDRPECYPLLLKCMVSVIKWDVNHRISISNCDDNQYNQIKELVKDRGECYMHKETKNLKQHLQYMLTATKDLSERRIMFLNFDDLLLNMPPDADFVKGIQFLDYHTVTAGQLKFTLNSLNINDSGIYIKDETDNLNKDLQYHVINDFSGYVCLKSDLQQIINHDDSPVEAMVDLKIMKYIDDMAAIEPPAFIFHRLWRSPSEDKWFKDASDKLKETTQGISESLNQPKEVYDNYKQISQTVLNDVSGELSTSIDKFKDKYAEISTEINQETPEVIVRVDKDGTVRYGYIKDNNFVLHRDRNLPALIKTKGNIMYQSWYQHGNLYKYAEWKDGKLQ